MLPNVWRYVALAQTR